MSEYNLELDSVIGDEVELQHEELANAMEMLERQRMRVLAIAFATGYDGVDVKTPAEHMGQQPISRFNVGFEWEGWVGEPEPLPIYAQGVTRYDFRRLSKAEKRELAGHAGITNLSEIPDSPRGGSDE